MLWNCRASKNKNMFRRRPQRCTWANKGDNRRPVRFTVFIITRCIHCISAHIIFASLQYTDASLHYTDALHWSPAKLQLNFFHNLRITEVYVYSNNKRDNYVLAMRFSFNYSISPCCSQHISKSYPTQNGGSELKPHEWQQTVLMV